MTYTSYKEHFGLYTEIHHLIDIQKLLYHQVFIQLIILQQRQDCEATQIKSMKLVIWKHYAFMALFIALGIPSYHLQKTKRTKVKLPLSTCKTLLPQKSLSLQREQIKWVKNEIDGQSSSLLAYVQVSYYKVAFTPMSLVFLELYTHYWHLDFKLLDRTNKGVIPRTFYFQLLN